MKSNPFRFKQFEIHQDRTAMKIGTDGVLLGAWAEASHPRRILDVGTGTGVIALMSAQRFPQALIEAVEIEAEAAEQARYNFQISPWKERLHLIHTDFKDFQSSHRYDLIVSNPPYFDEDYLSADAKRNLARHTRSLSLWDLIEKAEKYLSPQGSIVLILPVQKESELRDILHQQALYINRLTYVKGTYKSPVKRILLQISSVKTNFEPQELVIEEARHRYTAEYIALTKDFYLKM